MTTLTTFNTSWTNIFQTAGKWSVFTGLAAAGSCIALDKNYKYPCAIAAIGASAWFSVWLNQSAQQQTPPIQKPPLQGQVEDWLDTVSEISKQYLKNVANTCTKAVIAAGKTAAITCLPSGMGSTVAAALDSTEESMKGLSDKSIEISVGSSNDSAKESLDRVCK